jgi:hypothetical protein
MSKINIELYYVVRNFSKKEDHYECVAGPFATYLQAYREMEENCGVMFSKHYHVAKHSVEMELV